MIAKKNLYAIASSATNANYILPQTASLLVVGNPVQEPKRRIVSWSCEVVTPPNIRYKSNS